MESVFGNMTMDICILKIHYILTMDFL